MALTTLFQSFGRKIFLVSARAMIFRFGSWNINHRLPRTEHIEFLRSQNLDLVAMQEVTEEVHAAYTKIELFDWSVSSLTIRPPQPDEGRARRLGVSVFGRKPFRLVSSQVLNKLHLPERSLTSLVQSPAGPITVCSFHIPPGANWGEIKPQTQVAIARWLAAQEGAIVVGIDANAPKTDHPDPEKNEWWWDDEPLLLGQAPLHGLHDAFRVFLDSRPALLNEIRKERPTGPLAISHFRGRGDQRAPCRYDFIYVSSNIVIDEVRYVFKRELSDHALVESSLVI